MMITRRLALSFALATTMCVAVAANAAAPPAFTQQAFDDAQKAGKPILVEVHAVWCPVCKAQIPILGKLTSEPKFQNMVVLRVDFDDQKDIAHKFGAQKQSTLIVFKGGTEVGRSVGDSKEASIAALLDKAI